MLPIISKEAAVRFLISSIPDAEWLLSRIESEQGWFRFPLVLTNAIKNLKIDSYPLLYENEPGIAVILLRAFFDEQEYIDFCNECESATADERGAFVDEISSAFDNILESLPKTEQEEREAILAYEALPKSEQEEIVNFSQRWFCFFFASFFQNLSIMVHGEKLTSLVAQAKAGDDNAFVKAIQIDRRILTTIPYFKDRFAQAQDEADSSFSDKISYRLKAPPYLGKIRFKSLWLTFSTLDQLGLLDTLTHPEILKMCDDAGVGGFKNRIEDVKYLSKRLADYRRMQKRQIIATP